MSGRPAEFFSGLEIPVPTITDRGTIGTEYRQTGVSLRFTPTVLDNDQISLTVEPRIREVAGRRRDHSRHRRTQHQRAVRFHHGRARRRRVHRHRGVVPAQYHEYAGRRPVAERYSLVGRPVPQYGRAGPVRRADHRGHSAHRLGNAGGGVDCGHRGHTGGFRPATGQRVLLLRPRVRVRRCPLLLQSRGLQVPRAV